MSTIGSSSFNEYAGSYQLSPDRIIVLGPADEFGGNILWLDLQSREIGTLMPDEPDAFTAHVGLTESRQPISVLFKRDALGRVVGLMWGEPNRTPTSAPRLQPHRELEVAFENGPVTLHGTLYLPSTPNPHPAVVFAHGSGDATRRLGFFPMFCVLQGIAMLSFDKRGSGESSGDWKSASMHDLSSDVLAGLRLLRDHPDIRKEHVGILGSSQGGWVGSLAAAAAPDEVAFLVVRAGPGTSVIDAIVREREGHMRERDLDEASGARGMAFAQRLCEMASRGEAFEEMERLYLEIASEPWAPHVFPAEHAKDSIWWKWYVLNGAISSADALKSVSCPVLWFLAELDWNVPPTKSFQALQSALTLANNPDYRVIMLPGASHAFLEATTGYTSELRTATRYVAGFWDVLADWLKAHTAAQ